MFALQLLFVISYVFLLPLMFSYNCFQTFYLQPTKKATLKHQLQTKIKVYPLKYEMNNFIEIPDTQVPHIELTIRAKNVNT